jgi:predicted ester cyclase
MNATIPSGNVEVLRQLIELGFNRGKLDALDRIVAADFTEHQYGADSGVEALKELIRGLRAAFPDLRMTIEETAVSGDMVWARLRCRGTHRGPLMGIPPTGRSIDTMAVEICRFASGRLVEHWGVPDRFAALSQLGLLPTPSRPTAELESPRAASPTARD